jgi:hypothetical protein
MEWGGERVPPDQQAEYLERYTFPSMMSQTAREQYKWIIACDVAMGDDVCDLVEHVGERANAAVIWVVDREQTRWGEILRDRYCWSDHQPSRIVTVGLPAGCAFHRKYLETVHNHWANQQAGHLAFVGGVLVDSKGRAGYTRNQHNGFASRKEQAGRGQNLKGCYMRGGPYEYKESKTAWLIPGGPGIEKPERIDLAEFGV